MHIVKVATKLSNDIRQFKFTTINRCICIHRRSINIQLILSVALLKLREMAKASLRLLKYAILALLITAMVPMFEGVDMSKKGAVHVEKSKMVNGEKKGVQMSKKEAVHVEKSKVVIGENKGAEVSKKDAVRVEKPKMVNGENKDTCAKPGETCNPSEQISCCKGSTCHIPHPIPGASGTCVSEDKEQCKKLNQVCNNSARVVCCEGLECVDNKHPAGPVLGRPGKCMYKCAGVNETCRPSTQHFCCEHLRCKPDIPGLHGGAGKCVAQA